jgi:polyhydroxyalkanoate synthase
MWPRESFRSKRLGRLKFLFLLLFLSFSLARGWSGEAPFVSREAHWAVTTEKFELALERLRFGKAARYRVPVILSHGFFVNNLFLNLDEEHSLGRYLAREGFDVWNLSLRGIGRSLDPLKGGPKRWTLDDMIDKDLSAVIGYVRQESKSARVSWVGYELGGLLAYGYLVKKGGLGLGALVAIAAPATFHHAEQAPIKKLLKLEESPLLKKAFLNLNGPFLGRTLIPLVPAIERLFYNPENIAEEIKAKWLEETLAAINPGVLDHLLRMIKQGEFVSADGSFSYRRNLGKIQIPLLLVGGEKDPLAPPESMRLIHRAGKSATRTLRIFGPRSKDSLGYGHVDLILGKKAREEVFPVIARWLKQRDEGG